MIPDLDLAALVASFIEKHSEVLLRSIGSRAQRATAAVKVQFRRTYAAYLEELLRRTSQTKTFVIRDRPLPLSEIYVPVSLAGPDTHYPSVGITELTLTSQPSFITGLAGTGKSLLMRYLALDAIANSEYTPVFIELRRLSDSECSLQEFLHQTTLELGLRFEEDIFYSLLSSGRLLLLFDGFDEIQHAKRKQVAQEIISLVSSVYGRTPIFVSSRPDDSLEGWPYFRTLKILPLSLSQSMELVRRLPIAKEIGEAFLNELQKRLYTSRYSFASNPLLLSIMLLTFSQNAYVPLVRSSFFDKAYDALFEQHDALKPVFRRDRLSGLDIASFARLFSAFSLVSYDESHIQFSFTYARDLVRESLFRTGVATDPDSFIHDATQSVCLLVRDGLDLAYTHRSFQEYFAAKFIIDQASSNFRRELLERYSERAADQVLDLAFEINRRLVEQDFLAGKSKVLRKFVQQNPSANNQALRRFFRLLKLQFSVQAHQEASIYTGGIRLEINKRMADKGVFSLCNLLVRLYNPQDSVVDLDSWQDVVLAEWRKESGKDSKVWSFQDEQAEPLLTRLAAEGGAFSLAWLEKIYQAVRMMEEGLKSEQSVRELLELRRRSPITNREQDWRRSV